MRVSPEHRKEIEDMLWDGIDTRIIAAKLKMSASIINSIRREMGLIEKAEETKLTLYQWLRTHWNWKIENPPKKKTSGKYRVVKKGEKGIRTPYRPDGIFR